MNQFVPKESWSPIVSWSYILSLLLVLSALSIHMAPIEQYTINNTITPAIISFVLIYAVYTYDKLK